MILFLIFCANTLFALENFESLSAWKTLSTEEQLDHIYNYRIDSTEVDIAEVTDPKLKVSIDEMQSDALKNIDTDEIYNDIDGMENIASIGDPSLSSVTFYQIEDETVVIRLYFYQSGGATSNDRRPSQTHFESESEAIADGVDPESDVSWQAEAYFSWDGQNWRPMSYTNYEGRGFNWSGW